MDRAQRIISQAEHDAAVYLPGSGDSANGARLNYQIGLLRAQIRTLCGELERFSSPTSSAEFTVVEVETSEGYTVDAVADSEGKVVEALANGIDLLPLLNEVELQIKVDQLLERMREDDRQRFSAEQAELARAYA